jgi:SAM-dependent methyltransferase
MVAGVDGAVLDVGCGRGFTVGYLARHGVDCYGIEPADYSPPSADAAGRVYYGLRLQDLPKDLRERVRVVLILDVLEHLAEPGKLLEEVRNALPGATQLLVTLPARQEIWSNYDVYYGHQRRYSIPKLAEMAGSCDLVLLSAGYFFHALYLPAWLMRQARIPRSTVIKVPKCLFWHRLLANFFCWERKILPSAFWGTSLLATMTPRRQRDHKK